MGLQMSINATGCLIVHCAIMYTFKSNNVQILCPIIHYFYPIFPQTIEHVKLEQCPDHQGFIGVGKS